VEKVDDCMPAEKDTEGLLVLVLSTMEYITLGTFTGLLSSVPYWKGVHCDVTIDCMNACTYSIDEAVQVGSE
jgi:hypothetical protein